MQRFAKGNLKKKKSAFPLNLKRLLEIKLFK
jgi:hypothetical protein